MGRASCQLGANPKTISHSGFSIPASIHRHSDQSRLAFLRLLIILAILAAECDLCTCPLGSPSINPSACPFHFASSPSVFAFWSLIRICLMFLSVRLKLRHSFRFRVLLFFRFLPPPLRGIHNATFQTLKNTSNAKQKPKQIDGHAVVVVICAAAGPCGNMFALLAIGARLAIPTFRSLFGDRSLTDRSSLGLITSWTYQLQCPHSSIATDHLLPDVVQSSRNKFED